MTAHAGFLNFATRISPRASGFYRASRNLAARGYTLGRDVGQIYHALAQVDALEENGSASKTIEGQPIAVVKSEGKYIAFVDLCPHAGAQLSGGRVRKGRIICPLHGAPFSLETGKCLAPQPYAPLRLLPVRVVDGWIEVALP